MDVSALLLYLFCCIGLLFHFPLGKLPLPFLTREKGLYFWEQDTGQGLHLMVGYAGAVVVDFLFPRHRSHLPLKLPRRRRKARRRSGR